MVNSFLADSIARIRNGYMARKESIDLLHSKFVVEVLKTLKAEGYVEEFFVKKKGESPINVIELKLRYTEGRPAVRKIDLVSKPSCRRYIRTKDLLDFYNKKALSGLGTVILSTNNGVLPGQQALKKNVAGEILLTVF